MANFFGRGVSVEKHISNSQGAGGRCLRKSLKFGTALILIQALPYANCSGQESTGTLNFLLANRNGFIIAADSRKTESISGKYWDDSQKLFRIGPKSALVIAGFASWAVQGSPLDVQVASVLREEFADSEWASGRRAVTTVPAMISTSVGYQLDLLGALRATNKPPPRADELDFQVLAAGINKSGKVEIVRIRFRPRVQPLGPFDLATPTYGMSSTTNVVDSFVALSAGVDRIARDILDRTVKTQDRSILNYYRSRAAGQLDNLSLDALEGLAIAILAATKDATPLVGGSDQIGVFARDGGVKWKLPQLPTDRQKLISTILHVGFIYASDGLRGDEYAKVRGKNMITKIHFSLIQPFEQPFTQVFIGNQFRNVSVALDGNVFAGNHFNNVTFKYQGEPFYFPTNTNTMDSCVLEFLPNVRPPSALSACTPKPRSPIVLDGSIGSPMRAEPKGCVTRNAEGRLIIQTTGQQNDEDCTGSSVVVRDVKPVGKSVGN